MAFNNYFMNFNLNFRPISFNFSFGQFSMPNFFSRMPVFNCFSHFSITPWQTYNNPLAYNTPSIFNTQYNFAQFYTSPINTFDTYNFNNSWQNNFSGPNFDTFIYNTQNASSKKIQSSSKSNTANGTLSEYNSSNGKRLANIALSKATGFNNGCATSVKNAIRDAGLGEYIQGDAHRTDDILRGNSNFKEISVNGVNVKELPAGCVLVFEKGAQGYSKEYGHVEITIGDGRGVSDGITQNLKTPSAIFIPV